MSMTSVQKVSKKLKKRQNIANYSLDQIENNHI